MILIADSGSTKCDWVAVDLNTKTKLKMRTRGINPKILNTSQILERMHDSDELPLLEGIEKVFFYGAGCSDDQSKSIISNTLSKIFTDAEINVDADLVAAVHGATKHPGVVCILGTGSNCCHFDGLLIHKHQPAFGFMIMDDGSGNYFGKQLLRAYFYDKMPKHIKDKFAKSYDLDEENIFKNLYGSGNVSEYLAQFAKFLVDNRKDPFIKKTIQHGIKKVFDNLLNPYHSELQSVPLHFVGSIGYFLQEDIREEAHIRKIEIKSFVRRPINGLIDRIISTS
jgi:N-acetylglucosamine kinase-like BadF-type ATPase